MNDDRIRAYQSRGHLRANLDPLQINNSVQDTPDLEPSTYGFTAADMNRNIEIPSNL